MAEHRDDGFTAGAAAAAVRAETSTDESSRSGLRAGAIAELLVELARAPDETPTESSWPRPNVGTVVGRFELTREIGRGSFGQVWEAHDRELDRLVAFKLWRPGRVRIADDQFRREAEIIARFSHPNLVTLFDVGRSEYGPYLVLELLRGQTLQARLESGPLTVDEALRITIAIAEGLAHAHAQGVVHRDLKPSNVYLCRDGRVKLLDFGMSHAFGRRDPAGGTPAYMAPEQWRRAPEDERTDVYALGVLLYRMLAGELPFNVSRGGADVLSSRPAPTLDTPGDPGLTSLAASMLEKDPVRRPRDAADVLARLKALPRGADGAKVGPVRKRRPLTRRPALLVAGALVVALALLAGARALLRPTASPARARAIAVLPFDNVGGAADNDYLSDGLAEEILNLLTRVRELRVAASASSFRFKGKHPEPGEVASRLGVDVLLVGNVRREQDHLRIAAELVDARSGFRLWSQIYDRNLADVFSVQREIARQVVGALELVLSRASVDELGRGARAPSLVAYDLYLRGRTALRRPPTRETLSQARSLFAQAVATDASFAAAYAGLCDAWLETYRATRATEDVAEAERSCQQAIAHDGDPAAVSTSLGLLHLASGRHDEAERDLRRALAVRGGYLEAQLGLARVLAAQQRSTEAETVFAEAERFEPGDWRVYHWHGAFLFGAGKYAEAARQFEQAVARAPDDISDLGDLGAAHYLAGNFEQASKAWRAVLDLAPDAEAYSNVGVGYFYEGRYAESIAMYRKALELKPDDHRLWGNLGDAWTFVAGGEAEAARAYEKAIALAMGRLKVDASDAQARAELAYFHARLGHTAVATPLMAEALERDGKNPYVHYDAALTWLLGGKSGEALDALERAVALGYPRTLLMADPGFTALRGEARLAKLSRP